MASHLWSTTILHWRHIYQAVYNGLYCTRAALNYITASSCVYLFVDINHGDFDPLKKTFIF